MKTSIRTVLIFVWIELCSAQPFWDPLGIFDNEENFSVKTTTEKPILAQRTAEFNSSFFVVGKSKLVMEIPR